MLELFAYILLALAIVVAVIVLLASQRPNSFRIARTREIKAPAERLFPLINNLREMNTWNPYALRETGGRADYSGPVHGPGARFDFGGKKSGTGHIAVVDAKPLSNVTLRLSMVKPFKVDNTVEFILAPKGASTDVTWAMSGKQPLIGKVMSMFIDCDKMMGRDFEEGLANLKAIAEKA